MLTMNDKCYFCDTLTDRKIDCLLGDIRVCSEHTATIETGKDRRAYKVRYADLGPTQAVHYYNGLNTFGGHKKRLKIDDTVIARVIT